MKNQANRKLIRDTDFIMTANSICWHIHYLFCCIQADTISDIAKKIPIHYN